MGRGVGGGGTASLNLATHCENYRHHFSGLSSPHTMRYKNKAKGLPGSGGRYFFSNDALEGILFFISPLLYRKTGLCLLFLENNCSWTCWTCLRMDSSFIAKMSFKFHK